MKMPIIYLSLVWYSRPWKVSLKLTCSFRLLSYLLFFKCNSTHQLYYIINYQQTCLSLKTCPALYCRQYCHKPFCMSEREKKAQSLFYSLITLFPNLTHYYKRKVSTTLRKMLYALPSLRLRLPC